MSEMVERVARAICNAHDGYCPPKTPDSAIVLARAAIAAMRKPDRKVLNALDSYAQCEGFLDEGWEAAIDVALKDTD